MQTLHKGWLDKVRGNLLFNLDDIGQHFGALLHGAQDELIINLLVWRVRRRELIFSIGPIFPEEIIQLNLASLENPFQAVTHGSEVHLRRALLGFAKHE